jgi:hypothetical protein
LEYFICISWNILIKITGSLESGLINLRMKVINYELERPNSALNIPKTVIINNQYIDSK